MNLLYTFNQLRFHIFDDDSSYITTYLILFELVAGWMGGWKDWETAFNFVVWPEYHSHMVHGAGVCLVQGVWCIRRFGMVHFRLSLPFFFDF
jgi:hypothetical protein